MTPARPRDSSGGGAGLPPDAPGPASGAATPAPGSARARAAARGIELVLVSGRANMPRATFTPAVPPTRTTLGAEGERAVAGGAAPHVELAWDGATLWVRDTGAGAQRARIGAEPVGSAWRPLAGGEQLRVGQAVFAVAIPAGGSTTTTTTTTTAASAASGSGGAGGGPTAVTALAAAAVDQDATWFAPPPDPSAATAGSAASFEERADPTAVVDIGAGQVAEPTKLTASPPRRGPGADDDENDTTARSPHAHHAGRGAPSTDDDGGSARDTTTRRVHPEPAAAPAVPPPRFGTRAIGGAHADDPAEQTVVVIGSDASTARDTRTPEQVAAQVAAATTANAPFAAARSVSSATAAAGAAPPAPAAGAAMDAPAVGAAMDAPVVPPSPADASMFQRFGEVPPSAGYPTTQPELGAAASHTPGALTTAPLPTRRDANSAASTRAQRVRAAVAAVPVRTWVLFGVTVVMGVIVIVPGFLRGPQDAGPAPASAPRSDGAAVVETVGAAAPASSAPLRSYTPPVAGPAAGPTGTLLAASAPPAPPPPASAASSTPALPPSAVPERVAADTLEQGRYAEALAMYQALAIAHPDAPVYAQFATILRRKLEGRAAGGAACAPGTQPVSAGGGQCVVR